MRMTRGSRGSTRRDRIGRGEVGIGLVEAEDGVAGKPRDHLGDARAGVPAPGRVVRVGEIDERRPGLARGEEQRLGVLGVVAIGDGNQPPPETRDVEGEGRVGAGRGHDRRAGRDEEPDEQAEQAVDPLAHHDVLRPDAVVGGQRGLEVVDFGIAVHPGLGGGVRHRGDGARRGAEDALVGADAGNERPARVRSCVSGPTKGTVAGRLAARGVRRMANDPRGTSGPPLLVAAGFRVKEGVTTPDAIAAERKVSRLPVCGHLGISSDMIRHDGGSDLVVLDLRRAIARARLGRSCRHVLRGG